MIRRIAFLCLALVALAAPLRAQQAADIVELRVLPGWRLSGGTHMSGLEIVLRDGWKTYWRAPGDAGIPPRFDWHRSRNLTDVEVIWPTPQVIRQGGARAIGYAGRVVLPLRLTPERADRAISLSGTIDMGVCRDVCVPVTLQVSEKLTRGAGKPDPRIAAAMANRPYSASEAGVSRVSCGMSLAEDGLGLRAEIDMPRTGRNETAVFEVENPDIWVAPVRTVRNGRLLVAETRLYHVEGRSFALDRSGIRITVLGDGQAVDIQGCPAG